MLALFATVFAGKANRTQDEATYWTLWQDFKASGDRYLPELLTGEEHDSRFEIFKDNVDKITLHNKEGHSWKMGVTPFADMTQDEFAQKVVGSYCAPNFAKTAKLNAAKTKLHEGRRREVLDALKGNPSSVNWNTAGKVTNVKNQGQCGSCWAFSTTGAIEARTAIKNSATPVSLSEQELVDCSTRDAGCSGGAMQDGFLYSEEHNGLCLEAEYSYHAVAGSCVSSSCTHYSPVSDYNSVLQGESYLETAVAAGPVSIAIQANQMAFQLYTSGVFSGTCGTQLDHGVLAVGYDNSASQKYWVVKNSWGASWGENGYIRFCKDCDKNGSSGQCGIAAAAVYPII